MMPDEDLGALVCVPPDGLVVCVPPVEDFEVVPLPDAEVCDVVPFVVVSSAGAPAFRASITTTRSARMPIPIHKIFFVFIVLIIPS